MNTTYPTIAEYHDIKNAPKSVVTILASNPNPVNLGRVYNLKHHTAGYECAGAMARWTEEHWSVTFYSDSAINGRAFKSEEQARELFTVWTTKETQ